MRAFQVNTHNHLHTVKVRAGLLLNEQTDMEPRQRANKAAHKRETCYFSCLNKPWISGYRYFSVGVKGFVTFLSSFIWKFRQKISAPD